MLKNIKINNKLSFGENHPCFIIAEAGINHDGEVSKAKELVDVAVEAKADAVKFQMFDTNKYISDDAYLANYHKKGLLNNKESLRSLLNRLELKQQQFQEVYKYARKKNIFIFSTAFDIENAKFLFKLGMNLVKVASFSLTNYPLINYLAKKNYPMIISSGLHNLGEIEKTLELVKKKGNNKIALLQCTSHYPSLPKDANLRVMDTLKSAFECIVGYSDHTMGINVALASVAMGAKIIEKHYTLETNSFGADHEASLSPKELCLLVEGIREIEQSFGSSRKFLANSEKEIKNVHRPSLVSKINIRKGQIIKENMLDIKKPGTGISPNDVQWVVGRKVKKNILKNKLILKKDLV